MDWRLHHQHEIAMNRVQNLNAMESGVDLEALAFMVRIVAINNYS
jgi:hypothetical protein